MKNTLADTGILSKCTKAFIEQNDAIKTLLGPDHAYFSIDQAIKNKSHFTAQQRAVLAKVLHDQYSAYLGPSFKSKDKAQIDALNDPNTYTVTTGQQLHLCIGPAFVLYKIIAVIQLCKRLQIEYPDKRFIPVYWMASEDHDIDEIKDIQLFGKKYSWNTNATGAAGKLPLSGVDELLQNILNSCQLSDAQTHWINSFKQIYSSSKTLSEATFKCIHHMFEEDGLICIDADQAALKTAAIPLIKKDVLEQTNEAVFNQTTAALQGFGYAKQLHARPINCFYMNEQNRTRIENKGDQFHTVDFSKEWTGAQMALEIEQHPERFSPNAVLRPLYQELILPNVAYIGGNAEIQYWIQLSKLFENNQIEAPCLLLRPSVWLCPQKTMDWLEQRQISPLELLQNTPIQNLKIKIGGIENPMHALKQSFETLKQLAQKEVTKFNAQGLKSLVESGKQYEKQLQTIEQNIQFEIDKRIEIDLKKLLDIQQKYFNQSQPQERSISVLDFLLNYSKSALLALKQTEIAPNMAYIFSA